MATKKVVASTKSDNTRELKDAAECMDAISQEGFGFIESVARLARMALENADKAEYAHTKGDVVNVLRLIGITANENMDSINGIAEGVGCNHVSAKDLREMRRIATTT